MIAPLDASCLVNIVKQSYITLHSGYQAVEREDYHD